MLKIEQRPLLAQESKLVDEGFDTLYREDNMALESTEKISFAAEVNGQFVACAVGKAHLNANEYSGWFYLSDLFVCAPFRNQGIGEEVLLVLEKHLRSLGIQKIWLWTSGDASLRFYKRQQYQIFTEMENWYSDHSSRFGLRKTLL